MSYVNYYSEKFPSSKAISVCSRFAFSKISTAYTKPNKAAGRASPGCCSSPLGGSNARRAHPAQGRQHLAARDPGEETFSLLQGRDLLPSPPGRAQGKGGSRAAAVKAAQQGTCRRGELQFSRPLLSRTLAQGFWYCLGS